MGVRGCVWVWVAVGVCECVCVGEWVRAWAGRCCQEGGGDGGLRAEDGRGAKAWTRAEIASTKARQRAGPAVGEAQRGGRQAGEAGQTDRQTGSGGRQTAMGRKPGRERR